MIGDRIVDPLHVLRVTLGSEVAGIPVRVGTQIPDAADALAAARIGMLLSRGTYRKVIEDEQIAVYQPVRFNVVWNASVWWACYKVDLCPRTDVYSTDLPINVGPQDGPRLSAHHHAPSRNSLLWCYMKTRKFVSMLHNGGIQLTRADLFPDKDEGTLRPENLFYRRAVYADDRTMVEAGYTCPRGFRLIKHHTSISCWRLDAQEDRRSWDTYVGNEPGIALVTTYGELFRHVTALFCATVEYLDDGWIPEGNSLFPFIYKRKENYEWEREFRIIYQQLPKTEPRFRGVPFYDCSQPNPSPCVTLELDLNAVILKMFVGPNTPNSAKSQLRRWLGAADYSRPYPTRRFRRETTLELSQRFCRLTTVVTTVKVKPHRVSTCIARMARMAESVQESCEIKNGEDLRPEQTFNYDSPACVS